MIASSEPGQPARYLRRATDGRPTYAEFSDYPRVLFRSKRFDKDSGLFKEEFPNYKDGPDNDEAEIDKEHSFIWRRIWSRKGTTFSPEAEIVDPTLKKLIEGSLVGYPWHRDTKPLTFGGRFIPIVDNWEKLKLATESAYADAEDEMTSARKDLELQMKLVQGSKRCREYFDQKENNKKDQKIHFKYLWTIFRPGTIVVSQIMGELQAFLVCGWRYDDGNSRGDESDSEGEDNDPRRFVLLCWTYGTAHRCPVLLYLTVTSRFRRLFFQ